MRLAIEAAGTATELVMALRWNLQKTLDENRSLNDETARRIHDLVAVLMRLLGP